MPRPTRSAGVLVFLAITLELLSRLIGHTWLTGAAAAVIGAVTADAAMTPRIRGVVVRRTGPDRARVGATSSVELTVSVPAAIRLTRGPMVLDHTTPWGGQTRAAVPSLRAGETATVRLTTTPEVRGHWVDGAVLGVEGRSPLGSFLRRRRIRLPGEMWVQPPAATGLRLTHSGAGQGAETAALVHAGHGPDMLGLREWMSGDTRSMVNWRATARRSQLVVTESARPAIPPLMVAFGPAGAGPAWEQAVAVAAATAISALNAGVAVDVVRGADVARLSSSREILDLFSSLDRRRRGGSEETWPAMRGAGSGATVLWLGANPPSAYVAGAIRRSGARILTVPIVEPSAARP